MKAVIAGVFLFFPMAGAAAEACTNGSAGGFACSHVDLVGVLAPGELGGTGEELNDVWGWVDATNGDEYALAGMEDGTAFVRITDSGELVPLGRLPASDGRAGIAKTSRSEHKSCHDELCGDKDSAWRDIKVHGSHAYIVSEAAGHGLQIFDLAQLRDQTAAMPGHEWSETAFYDGIGHAHNLFINEARSRAYIVGHDREGVAGGLHVLDISEPTNPVHLAELDGDGYTHDVQCVVYDGPDGDYAGRELCLASNEDTLTIWDVNDVSVSTGADGASIVSRARYPGAAYVHQAWLSPDHRYVYLNDELDERSTGSRTHLRVFDVSDMDAPKLVADYLAPTLAIDHNNYAHGRWLYQSNYAAGLRILDVANPERPVEAAWFDTQAGDSTEFVGNWSNYLFPSGRVALSDVRDGLFVVQPTLTTATTPPDLDVELTIDESGAEVDQPVSGEIVVSNGTAADANDVLLTAHLPRDAAFTALTAPDDWSCDMAGGRVIECRARTVAADSESAFGYTLRSSQAGDVQVIAMAYANEADAEPDDNLADALLEVSAPPVSEPGNGGGGGVSAAALVLLLAGLRRLRVRR